MIISYSGYTITTWNDGGSCLIAEITDKYGATVAITDPQPSYEMVIQAAKKFIDEILMEKEKAEVLS